MDDSDLQPRSGVPLGHKVIAFFIAIAVISGFGWWQRNKIVSPSSAVLSFDPAQARLIDPGLASAAHPAAAFADSILSDQAVGALAAQAHLASSTAVARVGEFRSSLELSQPSPNTLVVRFVPGASGPSAATTNAVARALAAWTPSQTPAPAPATPATAPSFSGGSQPPATSTAATNQVQPRNENQHPSTAPAPAATDHALSVSLGELQAQLSATNRDLDRLAEEARHGHRSYAESSYVQSRQQSLLKTRVRAAERELAELRAHSGNQDTGAGTKARLDRIQQALDSILPGSFRRSSGYGFNGAGTSATHLRRERAQLNHAIGVVGEERQAIARAEAAQPAAPAAAESSTQPATESAAQQSPQPLAPATAESTPAAGVAPAPSPAAQTPAPSSLQEQTLPEQNANQPTLPPSASGNPLRVVSLAAPANIASLAAIATRLWPGIVAGLVCGLFYFAIAALVYRVSGSQESYEADSVYPRRFITPSGPIPPLRAQPSEPGPAAAWSPDRSSPSARPAEPDRSASPAASDWLASNRPAAAPEPAPVAASSRQRAAFTFESAPFASTSVRTPASPGSDENPVANDEPSAANQHQAPASDEVSVTNETATGNKAPAAHEASFDGAAALSKEAATASAVPQDTPSAHTGESREAAHPIFLAEEAENAADPLTQKMLESLSGTSIGKMFEGADESSQAQDSEQHHPADPDRMAS